MIVACQCNHLEVARLLLEHGADVNSRMVDGASAVFVTAQNGHSEMLSFLLRSGANAHMLRKVARTIYLRTRCYFVPIFLILRNFIVVSFHLSVSAACCR